MNSWFITPTTMPCWLGTTMPQSDVCPLHQLSWWPQHYWHVIAHFYNSPSHFYQTMSRYGCSLCCKLLRKVYFLICQSIRSSLWKSTILIALLIWIKSKVLVNLINTVSYYKSTKWPVLGCILWKWSMCIRFSSIFFIASIRRIC